MSQPTDTTLLAPAPEGAGGQPSGPTDLAALANRASVASPTRTVLRDLRSTLAASFA